METEFFQIWLFKDDKPFRPSAKFGTLFSVQTLANFERKKARKANKKNDYRTCKITIKPLR